MEVINIPPLGNFLNDIILFTISYYNYTIHCSSRLLFSFVGHLHPASSWSLWEERKHNGMKIEREWQPLPKYREEPLGFLPSSSCSGPIAFSRRKLDLRGQWQAPCDCILKDPKYHGKSKTEHLHSWDEGEDLGLWPTPTVQPCRSLARSGKHATSTPCRLGSVREKYQSSSKLNGLSVWPREWQTQRSAKSFLPYQGGVWV